MAIPELVAGVLPPGRHLCTESEIRARFVDDDEFATSPTRGSIWRDWQTGTQLLTGSVLVHTAWISGSFVSEKHDPSDIDVMFFVNRVDRAQRSVADKTVVESFVTRVQGSTPGTAVPAHGLSVDSFIVNWRPYNAMSDGSLSPPYEKYATERGYWDDFWSRVRVTPKALPSANADALPIRGYLEVKFNEFS